MRVLITGANGFIGRALANNLDEIPGIEISLAFRTQPLQQISQRYTVIGDLSPENDWREVLRDCDVVVHCAARAHIHDEKGIDSKSLYYRANVAGTLNLARQAALSGVSRFIFLSSIGVNGNTSERPFTEDDEVKPVELYAISKYQAELGLKQLSNELGLEVTIIRPPLVYGCNAPGNFGRLVDLVKKGLPLPLGAIRDNKRSFVAIDNLLDFVETCIKHSSAANQTFLVGDGQDVSTTELLIKIAHAMGRPQRLIPVPKWLLEVTSTIFGKKEVAQKLCGTLQVDISKAKELLGWEPPVSVDEGLKRAVAPVLSGKR